MKQQMITTNVRFPVFEYQQMKSIASDLGMSVNEYITYSAKAMGTRAQLFPPKSLMDAYTALKKIIDTPTEDKPMGMSEEDEAIYFL